MFQLVRLFLMVVSFVMVTLMLLQLVRFLKHLGCEASWPPGALLGATAGRSSKNLRGAQGLNSCVECRLRALPWSTARLLA